MPIHDLGYRAWPGKYSSDRLRFWVIASTGIRVAGRNKWLRKVLLAAWLPTFGLAALIFGYERLLENREIALTTSEVRHSVLGELGGELQDGDVVVEALMKENLQEGRHLMWSWLLSTYLRLPQAVMAMLVIGMIAPPLIARDVRTRAFLMYFSKPVGRIEYVLGKMLIVSTYVMSITTAPALGCYLFGVALSSDLNVLADTWDLPFRILLASLIFIIPSVSVALMFSSLTSESRFAAFAWFAFWGLGFIAWNVTYGVKSEDARRQIAHAQRVNQREHHDLQHWLDEAVELDVIHPSEVVAPPSQPQPGVPLTDEQRAAFERQQRRYEEMLRKVGSFGFADLDRRRAEAQIAEAQEEIAKHPMSMVSLYDTLVRLQRWVFGLESQWSAVLPSMIVTVSVTMFAWFILLRKVSAPIRV
jgi:ABC-2 type transport system permease protein